MGPAQLAEHISSWFILPLPLGISLGVTLAVLCGSYLAYRLAFLILGRLAKLSKTQVDDILLRRSRLPARVLIVLVALHTFLTMRSVSAPSLEKGIILVELLLLAYLVIETLETLFLDWWLQERSQIAVPAVLRHLLLIVLYLVAVLSIVGSVTGFNLVPLLTTSTVVTVVVGLALQDTLGNLFAGLTLHVEQPFGIGDWILVDGLEGRVIYQGWRSTRLKTFSGDVVAIPNGTIAKARVQNFSKPEPRTSRLIEWPVPLNASPHDVEAAVQAALQQEPRVLSEPAPKIWLLEITPFFQRYGIKVWIEDFALHDDIESELQKRLWESCSARGLRLTETVAVTAMPELPGSTLLRSHSPGSGKPTGKK